MKWGLSGAPIPAHLPYSDPINHAALDSQASPCALYAIAWRETLGAADWLRATYHTDPARVISDDLGHGIFQLTDSFPDNWQDPYANARYAAEHFYDPYLLDWIQRGYTGFNLLKLAADEYNAGPRRVLLYHNLGNADGATTGKNYGSDVVQIYKNLIAGMNPDTNRPS